MIQSSQPISLKFTWRCFRLQRGLAFTTWCWGWDCGCCRGFLAPLKRSRFLLLPNARKKAFSLLVLPGRANPRVRRSMGRPPRCSRASSSKHSCWECWCCWFLKPLKTFHTSNTSHLPPNPLTRSSMVFVWSRAPFCLPEVQVYSLRHGDGPPPPPPPPPPPSPPLPPSEAVDPIEALRGSDRRFLRMRSSAPRSPSRSRELMLK
uniref:Uncharacterized protein n=1 Tax=Seriola lalandi dorsalis TaxID=1841481 RepID=A0A3B4XEV6_SERLL